MAFEQVYSRHLNSKNREETKPRKKLKKRRSIRFSNGSWFRLSSKSSSKSQFKRDSDDFSSRASKVAQQASVVPGPDSSPNYMKSTSCFNAKIELPQTQEEIDQDDVNSVVSSSCGSSDLVMLPSFVLSDDAAIPRHRSSSEISDASAISLKAATYSEGRKLHDSESSYDSSDNGQSTNYPQSKSIYSGHRSLPTLSRSSSKRSVRIFIKKNSFNPRRTPLKNSQMSEDLNVERATCSSTIKDARFPEHVELEPGQTESERTSFVKVCPYHHCSLNGHCHDPPPSKKPFLRRRRQSSLPEKIAKSSSVSGPESKHSADKKKGSSKKYQMAARAEVLVHEASLVGSEGSTGRDMVLDGPSDPEKNSQRSSSAQEEDCPEASFELQETHLQSHSQKSEVEKSKAPDHHPLGLQKATVSKGKPVSMWHLIHKHMVSGVPATEVTEPLQGTDEGRSLEKVEMATARGSSNVSPDFSDSEVGNSKHDKENQDMEIRKLFAIKLVREAIEKILLPEVQDQFSENQSITSESVESQELTEKNHQEAPDEGCNNEGATPQVHVDGNITEQEMKKPETQPGKKSDKKSPSNWSNLKKWVLLQRFIKELEKVRKINYRKPQQLPLETDPSAEKVSLRRQTVDEKKKAEEWMLDYALQQVVSQLAPTQRRKVALLVKAFETVVPPQEDGILASAKATVSTLQEDGKRKRDNVTSKADKLESSYGNSNAEKPVNVIDEVQSPIDLSSKADSLLNPFSMDAAQGNISIKELPGVKIEDSHGGSESRSRNEEIEASKERSYAFPSKSWNLAKAEAANNLPAEDESEQEHSHLSPISEPFFGYSEPSSNQKELNDVNYKVNEPSNTSQQLLVETTATTRSLVHSTFELEALTWKATKSETMPEPGEVQVFPPQVTKPDIQENRAAQSPMDKQNYLGMWHMVCQHVVSSVATKLVLEEDEEETEEANKTSAVETSKGSSEERKHKAEFSRSQVLKLVKEAVQEILSPEIQDESSDTLSVSSEILPDPEPSEKDHNEGAKQSISNSDGLAEQNTGEFDRSKEGSSLDEEKELTNDGIIEQGSKTEQSGDKSKNDPPKPKNWMKLKKLILLKRSIKAMEKARKLNFPPPQLLPLQSEQEPEKVDLRSQMMDERRKAEQWMLDYAVQHIVTKLTPARKKRVAMLVEAFEAVVPLPET